MACSTIKQNWIYSRGQIAPLTPTISQGCWSGETAATHSDKIAHLLKRDSIYQQFPCFCRYMQHLSEIRGVELIHQSGGCRQVSDTAQLIVMHIHFTAGCWMIGQFLSVQIRGHLRPSVIAAYWISEIYVDYKAVKTSQTGWDGWQATTAIALICSQGERNNDERNSEPSVSRWDAMFNLDGRDDNSLVLGEWKMKSFFFFSTVVSEIRKRRASETAGQKTVHADLWQTFIFVFDWLCS